MLSYGFLCCALAACQAVAANQNQPVQKDVLIIGGGASGAHAAVRLRDDYGLSIVLVEKQDILGGHVDSYTDPESGDFFNYGVQNWVETGNATAFVSRFGIETTEYPRVATTPRYIDFATAQEYNYTNPTAEAQRAALEKYLALCEKYEHMIYPGYWNFPSPEDIPDDLIMTFGEFVRKYEIEAAVPTIWRVGAMGSGDVTKEMTFYVMQSFGAVLARAFTGAAASWIPASGRNQDLYDAIDAHLGGDVHPSSTVVDAVRNENGVTAVIKNHKTGRTTEIVARALVVAVSPTLANLEPLHLTEDEEAVFRQFTYTNMWAGILANEALPRDVSLQNVVPGVAAPSPEGWLAYPERPFVARFEYMGGSRLFRVIVPGDGTTTDAEARRLIQDDFERMINSGVLPEPASRDLEYVAWEAHEATHGRASRENVERGFIQRQYALQGTRATWWTGGAFSSSFQTSLWEYNDVMLPKLVAALEE